VDFIEGEILLFNKPYDWTSFDLVNKIRVLLKNHLKKKNINVGHAGTLDPLATGLMIVCTVKATKKIEQLTGLEKEYIATLELGATTPTYDLESMVDQTYPVSHITEELVRTRLHGFLGEQQQIPPKHSAIKIKGKKAYELARMGEEVELKSLTVVFFELELVRFEMPELVIRIRCSKGTYVRSFANDFGQALGSGAYLKGLIRTRIGDFSLTQSLDLENFEKNLRNNVTN